MPHYTEYKCTQCGRVTERSLLTAKKAVFSGLGAGSKIVRSRTVAWLCDECLPKDADFQREGFTAAPGMRSEPLERVRAAGTQDRVT